MDLVALKSEIDTDPLTRGYSGMTNRQIADDLNTVYRTAAIPPGALMDYLLFNEHSSGDDTDTTDTPIWGRVLQVSQSAVGVNPFGRTGTNATLSLMHIHSAMTLVDMARANADSIAAVSFDSAEFDAIVSRMGAGANGCRAVSVPQVNALKALSDNQQTRGNELGLGRVREGDVDAAKALP